MKNKFKTIITNKYAVAALCFLVAGIIAFGVIPMQSRKTANGVDVIQVKSMVAKGTRIEEKMLETVNRINVPTGSITDKNTVIGKYAVTDIYPGDYIIPDKITASESENNFHKADAQKDRYAISVTMDSLSSSVSGKVKEGDVVTVFGYSKDGGGLIYLPELAALEVLSVSGSKGETVNNGTVPETVTLLASLEQAKQLVTLEMNGNIHLAFAGRGDDAKNLLKGGDNNG